MMRGGEGREGDWECSGCANRNYAFRSFCNRCKQPRVLVDHKTPADSKWLPRIGDWICSGCTNNNYASREKCKKCGQPKEVTAMPAIAMPGASLPTHPQYFARIPGVHDQKINAGFYANGAPQPSLPLTSGWPLGGDTYGIQTADKFGVQPLPAWPLGGIHNNGIAYTNQANQVMVQKGWRNGDWICKCGFHNYSSRLQCKKCDAPMPPALGTKRLASEDVVQEWDSKRLNAGHTFGLPQAYPSFEQNASTGINQTGIYPHYPGGSSSATPNLQVNVQVPQLVTTPSTLARQWRGGDWMCTNCSNHNYASRAECNRCKTQREGPPQPVGVDAGASIVGADVGASAVVGADASATTVPGVGISTGFGVA